MEADGFWMRVSKARGRHRQSSKVTRSNDTHVLKEASTLGAWCLPECVQ